MIKIFFLLTTVVSFYSSAAASATPGAEILQSLSEVKAIEVSKAWARPSLSSNNNSALYFDINNTTDDPIVLIGAVAIDVANSVEIHKSFVDEKGISKMTPIDKLLIPAHSTLSLTPGGIHIMLNNLKIILKEGQKFKVELKFQQQDAQTIEVEVKSSNYSNSL